MGCTTCSVSSSGTPTGCGDKGHCSSGSCNKMNTFDWINTLDLADPTEFNVVEVSFKKGARKSFFMNPPRADCITGDMVVVEAESGYDVGRISLSGDLVRAQMKKKNFKEEKLIYSIIRKANHRDLEKLEEARAVEHKVLVKARVIARSLDLDMKIGDVEYQGDKRKATYYYTAEGRVDFRELVRMYAKEFRVKIEMRQIGSRQESARIGGIGACGRELCCSTWLSNFRSVNTMAARYQNIAINQTKLSGQCGRLKCCLNYELDMYMEALSEFPRNLDMLKTKDGEAYLVKTDIFKGIMYFAMRSERGRGPIIAIDKKRVWEVKEMNDKGKYPTTLVGSYIAEPNPKEQEKEIEYADVTGEIVLPSIKRRGKGRKSNKNRSGKPNNRRGPKPGSAKPKQAKPSGKSNNPNQKNRTNKPKGPGGREKKGPDAKNQSRKNRPNKKRNPNQNNPQNRNKKD